MDLGSWLTGIVLGAVIALVLSLLTRRPLGPTVPNVVAIVVLLATYALLTATNVTPALFIANALAALAWFLTDRIRKTTATTP